MILLASGASFFDCYVQWVPIQEMAYSAADFVVIAVPTNYDSSTQHFDRE